MADTTQRFRTQIRMVQDAGALTNASFAVVTLSLDGELLAVNPAAAEFFGTVEGEPALSSSWQDTMQSLVSELSERVIPSFEKRITTRDKQDLVVAVWRNDDTVRVALRKSSFRPHREGFKYAALDVLATTGDEYFRSLVQTCATYLEMNMVGLGVLTEDGNCARILAMSINGELVENTDEVPLEGMPCHDVKDKGFTLYSENVQQRFPEGQLLEQLGAVGYLGLPVRSRDGRVVALLNMTSRKPLTEDHIHRETLLLLADRTAAEIERQDQLASLLTENAQAKSILDNITDGIFINDTKGRMLHANPALLTMFGYDLDTFCTLTVKDLIDPSDIAVQPVDMQPILAGENVVYERRFIAKDSSVFRAEANIRLLPDNRIATVVRALESRERDKRRLERSESRFRRVVESNMLGVFFWNFDGQITDANDRFLKLVGYSRQSLARGDMNWRRMTPHEWRKIDDVNMKLIRRDGRVEPFEKRLIHSEGHVLPVLIGAALYEGTNEGVAYVLDLSEIKATERALADGQTSLSTLIDNLPGVVFRSQVGVDWPITYISDSVRELTGYSADEYTHHRRFLTDIVHPEDARRVTEARKLAVDEQRQIQVSYRVVNASHEQTWVWEQTRPVFNEDGKMIAFEGFIADNSERYLLEEQLKQAQRL
ncbi:MAG: PAS domain-containing protein, partial [Planctomycetota bacterium]